MDDVGGWLQANLAGLAIVAGTALAIVVGIGGWLLRWWRDVGPQREPDPVIGIVETIEHDEVERAEEKHAEVNEELAGRDSLPREERLDAGSSYLSRLDRGREGRG